MEKQNLWGDLGSLGTVRTPSMILREQAELLRELTNEILYGEVERVNVEGTIYTSLNLVAPVLQRYRFKIVQLSNTVNMYPVTIRDLVNGVDYNAPDESQFVDILSRILSSPKVKQAIAALISESNVESDRI